ncbi:MAG TPA: hypothetical protein VHC44_14285 [Verrucomicrobiae bacterium]|nr:hypothetical protein [Verrucomicrobiae bacterium]
MTAALALLPVVLQYLPTVESGAEHLWAWVTSVRTAAQQSGEWTADMEQQYRDALQACGKDPAWQPDLPKS